MAFLKRSGEGSVKGSSAKWMGKADSVIRQFDALNRRAQHAARSGSTDLLFEVFENAQKELPKISDKLKCIKPKTEEEMAACAILQEGLNSYMLACESYLESMRKNDTELYRRAGLYMNDAGKLLKEAVNGLRQISND